MWFLQIGIDDFFSAVSSYIEEYTEEYHSRSRGTDFDSFESFPVFRGEKAIVVYRIPVKDIVYMDYEDAAEIACGKQVIPRQAHIDNGGSMRFHEFFGGKPGISVTMSAPVS